MKTRKTYTTEQKKAYIAKYYAENADGFAVNMTDFAKNHDINDKTFQNWIRADRHEREMNAVNPVGESEERISLIQLVHAFMPETRISICNIQKEIHVSCTCREFLMKKCLQLDFADTTIEMIVPSGVNQVTVWVK